MKPRRLIFTRRRFLRLTAAAAASAAATGLYTWRVEPHWLEVEERPMGVARLPKRLVGARLAQLSDLHIGLQVDEGYLLDVFDRVRALRPEIVVYTGDFTSHHAGVLEQVARMFKRLPLGTRGTFGVLGNHDYGDAWGDSEYAEGIAGAAAAAGVTVLRNEVAEVDGLQVAGFDDLWSGRFRPREAISQLKASRGAIALSHNPDTADLDGWDGFSGWILSGHTHGGQCKPPFLPPPLLPVENRRYTSGEFGLAGGRRMYISRGVGHLMRVRFNARPEVTLFTLAEEPPAAL